LRSAVAGCETFSAAAESDEATKSITNQPIAIDATSAQERATLLEQTFLIASGMGCGYWEDEPLLSITVGAIEGRSNRGSSHG
jgi:hypothetical protein